ncbi:hypothetical protein KK083_21610 [Fulvivirgaceae bacterium PWU4]|uniref:Uncharacterized protein n=1 Tax=Chryseosolibacter histidini TaxID=2782349 RepID=A0AAP2DNA8_9BACT|nr:hypothetical protein [Chryseosolibacter histidini]MBT1699510.1 hypothetical protein [Chryseosolibacter histidini]
MKKLIALIVFAVSSYITHAQSCTPSCPSPCPPSCTQTCDKKLCTAGAGNKEEAAITTMRNDLQTVIAKMSKSSLAIDGQLKDLTIEKGASDEESLRRISQAAASVRYQLLRKLEPSKLVASLKDYKASEVSTKQQMLASLQEEIELLAAQAEKL